MLIIKTFLIAVFYLETIIHLKDLCVSAFCLHVYMYLVCLWKSEDNGATLWVLELNLDPFQEQGVLTSELLAPALLKDGN